MKTKLLKAIIMLTKRFLQIIVAQTLFYTLAIASEGNSQRLSINEVYIELDGSQMGILDIFTEIESQSQFKFSYEEKDIDEKVHFVFNTSKRSIYEILIRVSKKASLKFRRLNDVIDVSRLGKNHPKNSIEEVFIDRTITGKVTDENGNGLPGANVLVKDTNFGTITDTDGNYKLSIPDNATILVFSFVGYLNEEVEIAGRSIIDLQLTPDISTLSEIIVVGYGEQKKAAVNGAVSTVSTEEIAEIPAATLAQTLAGRASGLFITQSGGKPGRASNIRVRTGDSFNGRGTSPLFVIDGIISDQFAFDGLDPSEVANISVLKDGASAAVYGARAANGVILVTTKKGKSGKPVINYTFNLGIEEETKRPEGFTAFEQAKFNNAAFENKNDIGNPGFFSQEELDYFQNNSYDILDQLFKRPTTAKHALNVSGGNDQVTYFIGGSYYKGTGTFDNLEFERYNLRAKVEAKITDNLSASLNLNTDTRNDDKPFWRWDGDSDDFTDLYRNSILRNKFAPLYINGLPVGNNLAWHPGEVVNGSTGYNRKTWTNYNAIIGLEYEVPFIKGLKLKTTYNRYQRGDFRKEFNLPYELYVFETRAGSNKILTDVVDPTLTKTRNDGEWLRESFSRDKSYQYNFHVTYERQFGDHNIGALFVYEQAEGFNDNFFSQRNFFISPSVDQLFAGSTDPENSSASGSGSESARLSYVGRVNYSWRDQIFVETTLRVDGSLVFPESGRFGYFPSASVGWRISEADFFKNKVNFISNLKLRASYANVGNDRTNDDPPFAPFQYLQNYNIINAPVNFGNSLTDAIVLGSLPIDNLTWEKKRSINYGFDAAFLDNKLTTSLDVFHNKRSDILGARIASVPSTFGAALPPENYGIVESMGYEFEIGYKQEISSNLSFYARMNYGHATNNVIQLDEPANFRDYQKLVGFNTDRIFGLVYKDIIRTQADLDALPAGYTIMGEAPALGMINYVDIRGADSDEPDGSIDNNDRQYIAGHSEAPNTFGLILGGNWKGLSIDIFIQGLSGHQKMIAYRDQSTGLEAGNHALWADYWTPENTDAAFPRAWGWGQPERHPSSFWLRDASFIRLKNLNIGYDIPESLIDRVGISRARVFVNGTNLFLLKDEIKDFDPEGNNNTYPLSRGYTFGLNITL